MIGFLTYLLIFCVSFRVIYRAVYHDLYGCTAKKQPDPPAEPAPEYRSEYTPDERYDQPVTSSYRHSA